MKILKNLDWVHEIINEYANTNIMHENSIIYGGIVRDIIAKKKPEGDIDLAILSIEFTKQLNDLIESCKWKKTYKSLKTLVLENKKYKTNIHSTQPTSNINSICEFKNNNNKILQLITTKDITKLICNVDFVCCGIGMDYKGNIIEYLDGAYDDCINHRLRLNINHSNPKLLVSNFKKRLAKLVKRGWIPYNISKNRKILYKKAYIKNRKVKNEKLLVKSIKTRKEFLYENLYVNKSIIINKILFDLSKYKIINFRDLLMRVFGKKCHISVIKNKKQPFLIEGLQVFYTPKIFDHIKHFFYLNLPKNVEGVYIKEKIKLQNKISTQAIKKYPKKIMTYDKYGMKVAYNDAIKSILIDNDEVMGSTMLKKYADKLAVKFKHTENFNLKTAVESFNQNTYKQYNYYQ